MKRFIAGRVDAFGALGQAAANLARAEGVALQSELRGNARRLVGVALLFLSALFVAFWTLGALVFALVEVGAQWLPRWAAALILVAVLALLSALLALVARRRLARIESPAATVRRRAEEAQGWWEDRIGGSPRRGPSAAGGDAGADGRAGRPAIKPRGDA